MKKHILLIAGWSTPVTAILENDYEFSYLGDFFDDEILKNAMYKKEIDTQNCALCLFYAKQFHKDKALDAVISFNEKGLNSAIIIKEHLDIEGLDFYPTLVTKNKHLTRDILSNSKELKIPFMVTKSKNELKEFLLQNKKIVLKPKSGAASRDVIFIDNELQLNSFIKNIDLIDFIAEKYIGTNKLYSIETLSFNRVHSIFSTSVSILAKNSKYSIQNHIISPAKIDEKTCKIISKCINTFLNSIKLINGIAHTELKITDNKAYIIESQTRIGGDKIYKSVLLTTGYCQINEYFKYLFKKEKFKKFDFLASSQVTCYACIILKKGKIKYINTEKLKEINEIIEYKITVKKASYIKIPKDNANRAGFVYFKTKSHENINKILAKIRKAIIIKYDDNSQYFIDFKKQED